MDSPHLAVQLPEVVSQILWHLAPYDSGPDAKQHHNITHYRDKHHLAPCLLVNRLWHECTLRHLWRHVVFEDTKTDIAAFYHFASVLANTRITLPKPLPSTSLSSTTLSSLSVSTPSFCESPSSRLTPSPSTKPLPPSPPPPTTSSIDLYRKSIRSVTLRRIKEKAMHESLAAVAHHATHLQRLELYICDHVTNACLVPFFLVQPQTHLTHVSLAGCHRVSDESIVVLARHAPDLVHLDLRACGLISDVSVMAIAQSCPWLRHLNVGRIRERSRITSQSMVMIAKHTQVTVLGLAGCDIDDHTLLALAQYRHKTLERVSVNSCSHITNRSIQCLVKSTPLDCPQLSVFEMKECHRIDDWYTVHALAERKVSLTMNDQQKYEFQEWCVRNGKNGMINTPIKHT
ncbi:hypothetical protein BCR42DRAFT_363806 [Absidia repens]|uniref:F-box domain-containing protein n=1 Tax=Absidia repens TaxID=90262 RepID=A0A1X2J138_9FUNG|nr:hypothetical protein BCR42DRAFT_363806 [Absidia repens]